MKHRGDPVHKARHAVVQEARELLLLMEQTLARVAADTDAQDALNELFRIVHTIKGSAELFGFERLVNFTHLLENALDKVRKQQLVLTPSWQALLVDCGDHIAELVDAIAAHQETTEPDAGSRHTLEDTLLAVLAEHGPAQHNGAKADVVPANVSAPLQQWRIDLRFSHDLLRHGIDPAEFLRILDSFGTLLEVRTHTRALPPAADLDPESCYLRFSLLLAADCEQEEIDEVFEFIREDSHIVVEPLQQDAPPRTAAMPDNRIAASANPPSAQAYVKVPVDQLDVLINLVGELVIAGASASQVAQQEKHPAFQEAVQSMEALVGQLRAATLTLRMIPIDEVFQRFPRIVRSVARQLDKDVRLTMSGGDTELDKSMMEKLSEPLMHLVRNAIDHGLETAHDRLAAGKPPTGTLHLAAYHDAGSMVIEVSDDGRGLDYERIKSKAVERGLLGADEPLSEDDACRLLFEPGFSTRDQATTLSGRGVGMDVVRQRLDALRGETELISQANQGTTVRLRLPLTLAIIDGFLVTAGNSCFVIPLDMMVECLDPRQHEIHGAAVALRGESLPCLRLRDVFGLPPGKRKRESLVVVQYGRRQRAGLIVDRLLGEFQTVIKPLGSLFDNIGGLSGSTILGDGQVALILNIPQLIQRAIMANTAQADAADHG